MSRKPEEGSYASIAAQYGVSVSALKRHARDHLPRYLELNEFTVIPYYQDERGAVFVDVVPYRGTDTDEIMYAPLKIVLKAARRRYCIVTTEEDRQAARQHYVGILKHAVEMERLMEVPYVFDLVAHSWPAFRVLG